MRSRSAASGHVTAEVALAMPCLLALLGMVLWGLGAVAAQLQCGDAARAGARAAARGEPVAAVREVARSAAPPGAEIRVTPEAGRYRVRVTAAVSGPGPLAVRVAGEAVAGAEQP
ncbi:TadE family type IV pilus minor pilin [Streptomyces aidingensis]|uniref:TadE-like protein n=1 Tax=Streptomyces aidingensis TaxID=910347 RepID=A0A1I1KTN9_9ACTN|nr:TadE family type IV pilus minor pilin [Streptomyces aidingensis]SFC60820.1 TadE-like protein [Streptomyces aidingensis]